jgi:hypothetical protein
VLSKSTPHYRPLNRQSGKIVRCSALRIKSCEPLSRPSTTRVSAFKNERGVITCDGPNAKIQFIPAASAGDGWIYISKSKCDCKNVTPNIDCESKYRQVSCLLLVAGLTRRKILNFFYRGNRRRTPAALQTKTKVLSRSRVPGEKKRRSSPGACIHFFLSPKENIRGCFSYTRACEVAGGNFLSHYGAIYFSSLIFKQRPTSITHHRRPR